MRITTPTPSRRTRLAPRVAALQVLAALTLAVGSSFTTGAGPLSAQSVSGSTAAKESASQARATQDAAALAARRAVEDAVRAATAARAAESAVAAAWAAAAQAEAGRQSALKAQAEREAAAAQLAARAAAAEAAAARAQAEEAKRLLTEAASLKAAADAAVSEKEHARAAAAALAGHRAAVESVAATNAQLAQDAKLEAEAARVAAGQSTEAAARAAEAANRAAAHAADAEIADLAYRNASTEAERRSATEALQQASDGAGASAAIAAEHGRSAGARGALASGHTTTAQRKAADLLAPPALTGSEASLTSRSWLLCGGSYPGWGTPGLCAAVKLDLAGGSATSGSTTLTMRIRNLSGLFGSYAGSVLTGIGLSFLATEPRDLQVQGRCEPSDQSCAAQWQLAVGSHAHMPNGIGSVGMKIFTRGILGGIASTCADNVPQYDENDQLVNVAVPTNPNGLYTNDCYGDDWTTFAFTATAPVDFNHTQVSLRAQNGYPNGEGSTACIYSGASDTPLGRDCMPVSTVPEPTTMVLLGSGLAGVAGAMRRRRRKHDPEMEGSDA